MSTVIASIASQAPSQNTARLEKTTAARPKAAWGQMLLSVSSFHQDHATLREILFETPWRISIAYTCRQAMAILRRKHVSVIFCESDLPDGTWCDLLHLRTELHAPPLMIVTSRLADDYLWAEVLNLGGYDVLAKPFHEKEVRHVIASAGNQIEDRHAYAAGVS